MPKRTAATHAAGIIEQQDSDRPDAIRSRSGTRTPDGEEWALRRSPTCGYVQVADEPACKPGSVGRTEIRPDGHPSTVAVADDL
jgi:hypothetical protein